MRLRTLLNPMSDPIKSDSPDGAVDPAAICSASVTRFAFAVAILEDALASNRVPHVRTDIVTVDAPTREHASGVVLQQVLFECAMKRPQSALLHCRVMDVERLSKANTKLSGSEGGKD